MGCSLLVKISSTLIAVGLVSFNVEGISITRNSDDGWPTNTFEVPPNDLYDCIFLFFVCTDKASGSWPDNREKCTKFFNSCQGQLGLNFTDPTAIDPPDFVSVEGSTTLGPLEPEEPVQTEDPQTTQPPDSDQNPVENPDVQGLVGEEDTGPVVLPSDLIVQSCWDLLNNGTKQTGVHSLQIGPDRKDAFCDMQSLGGGWTVVQRRGIFPPAANPPNYFLKNWTDYRNGFGAPSNELWLGLESIFLLTNKEPMQLLVTLDDWEGNRVGLFVNEFRIANEKGGYRIFYSSFSSDLGKSLPARGTKFSTIDRDNDAWSKNCAERFSGAWWYSACHNSNLNGLYLRGEHESFGDGVNWYHWKGYHYSLKNAVLKIRPQRLAPTTTSTTTTTTTTPGPS